MKSVKKFTSKLDIIVFICVTILFLYQLYGLIDPEGMELNIYSEAHKIVFTIFFLAISTYILNSYKILLLGILTIVCISLCLDFRGEYELEIVLKYATVYLLALPLSELLRDAKRQLYLKWFAILYSCISLVNLLGCYLLLLEIGLDILPSKFSFYMTRLSIGPHPNVTAIIFSISIGMLVFLFFEAKKVVTKVSLFLLICAYFPLLWLTNSRTNTLLMTLFVMGILFLGYLNKVSGVNVRRIAILLLSLCACAVLLLMLYSMVFSHHRDLVLEETNANVSLQMSFWESLGSFNGRTDIWKATIHSMLSERKYFLFGTSMTVALGGAWHAHNAWLQFFVNFGVFGLLFSLYYTFSATKAAIVILILKWDRTTMAQKVAALLVLVLLVANTMEPYIFVNLSTYINFTFFLLVGYVMTWERDLKEKNNG